VIRCSTCDQETAKTAIKVWSGRAVCPSCFAVLSQADSETLAPVIDETGWNAEGVVPSEATTRDASASMEVVTEFEPASVRDESLGSGQTEQHSEDETLSSPGFDQGNADRVGEMSKAEPKISSPMPGNGRPIGGWLRLFAVGLLLAYIGIPISCYSDRVFMKMLAEMANEDGFTVVLMNVFLVGAGVLLAFNTVVCSAFFRKKVNTPRLVIAFLLFRIAWGVTTTVMMLCWWDLISQSLEYVDAQDVVPETVGYLVLGLLYEFLWIAYFMKSKRVRETFVIPRGGHSTAVPGKESEPPVSLESGADEEWTSRDTVVMYLGLMFLVVMLVCLFFGAFLSQS
jgi:hypothetical protein